MPTNNLEGLNLIHPIDDNINDDLYADLANTTLIPDLDAQLKLWTNLAFQSDEPFIPRPLSPTSGDYAKSLSFANNTTNNTNSNLPFTNTNNTEFDMNKFLAGFALDPFLVPPTSDNHNHNNVDVDPASDITSLIPPIHPESQSPSISTATPTASPASKRQKVRTKPVSPPPAADFDDDADEGEGEAEIDSKPNLTTPVTASEDKRRRNTAASARFRAKKKEREVALEKKSKELETRVNELERECEALKRENGWLKGLVVGVTGASQAPAAGAKRRRAERDEEQDVKI